MLRALETVCADARTFELERRDFALCLVPMQTVQLLGGASRPGAAFLRRARAHLRPGGLLACAIVTELEPFDCAAGDLGPSPEIARVDGSHLRQPRDARAGAQAQHPHRARAQRARGRRAATSASTHIRRPERDVMELDRLSAPQLQREGREAGLTAAGTRAIAATEEHVGSAVVMLRA